jgi:hypothetical protein
VIRKRRELNSGHLNGISLDSNFLWFNTCSRINRPSDCGVFPSRPPDAPAQKFTGVIVEYGLGNDTGGFVLTIGGKSMDFYIGLPMRMNGAIVRCQDPDPNIASPASCTDWPPSIVLGKSVVTATCWIEMFSPDMALSYTPGMSTSTPKISPSPPIPPSRRRRIDPRLRRNRQPHRLRPQPGRDRPQGLHARGEGVAGAIDNAGETPG